MAKVFVMPVPDDGKSASLYKGLTNYQQEWQKFFPAAVKTAIYGVVCFSQKEQDLKNMLDCAHTQFYSKTRYKIHTLEV